MNIKPKVLFQELFSIHSRRLRKGFVTREENKKYNQWVVTAYAKSPIAILNFPYPPIDKIFFDSQVLPHDIKLSFFPPSIEAINGTMILPNFGKIPDKSAADTLRLMASPFIELPKDLDDLRLKRISQYEFEMSYTAAYIIRKSWSPQLCRLPKWDNKMKSFLDAESEVWLRIANLCMKCRDLLPQSDLKRFPRSWDWFDAIVSESRSRFLFDMMREKTEDISTKKDYTTGIRVTAKALENGDNPFDSSIHPEEFKLFTIASNIPPGNFKNHYLKPYISSLRNWADAIDHCSNAKFNPISGSDGWSADST
ncbi:MAG: hypothetical protein AAF630_00640 [Cyanobacteria bacterium P01_C01_bin.38]